MSGPCEGARYAGPVKGGAVFRDPSGFAGRGLWARSGAQVPGWLAHCPQGTEGSWPEARKKYPPRPSKLDPYKPVIDQMLVTGLDAPPKQRHTVTRIYAWLIDEHQMGDVSYQVVRAYVAQRRPQIRVEHGREPVNAFIVQSHLPGMGRGRLRRGRDPGSAASW